VKSGPKSMASFRCTNFIVCATPTPLPPFSVQRMADNVVTISQLDSILRICRHQKGSMTQQGLDKGYTMLQLNTVLHCQSLNRTAKLAARRGTVAVASTCPVVSVSAMWNYIKSNTFVSHDSQWKGDVYYALILRADRVGNILESTYTAPSADLLQFWGYEVVRDRLPIVTPATIVPDQTASRKERLHERFQEKACGWLYPALPPRGVLQAVRVGCLALHGLIVELAKVAAMYHILCNVSKSKCSTREVEDRTDLSEEEEKEEEERHVLKGEPISQFLRQLDHERKNIIDAIQEAVCPLIRSESKSTDSFKQNPIEEEDSDSGEEYNDGGSATTSEEEEACNSSDEEELHIDGEDECEEEETVEDYAGAH
jgi:hypothetical protein